MQANISGKVIVITGASRGLGEATARHCSELGTTWSPISGPYNRSRRAIVSTKRLAHPVIGELASKYGKAPAQIILRWHWDHGFSAIPQSMTPSRIAENFAVFDFALTPGEIAAIDALETGTRAGANPDTFDRNSYPITMDN